MLNLISLRWKKGFGITTEKKDKGYSRWAKDKEIQQELTMVPLQAETAKCWWSSS